ncbi:hypothetical protein UlMin_004987 [Ulmus minor]
MDNSQSIIPIPSSSLTQQEPDNESERMLIHSLPKAKGWLGPSLSLYQGFWCPSKILPNIISFQTHYQAHHQDIILASKPKSGTTWLKALLFSITNRTRYTLNDTPLLTSNPHELVPFFEFTLYGSNRFPNLDNMVSPRLFSTHIPYPSLPDSVKQSRCRIVYVCRNPLDIIVSHWHFATRAQCDQEEGSKLWTLEEFVNAYCRGEEVFGPFWDHMLSYRKESKENPEKVLFLKYEDLKQDTSSEVKKIAKFIGFPFSLEEEKKGIVEEILKLCSLGNLKELDVNKHGKFMPYFDNKSYFRKGEVGDWKNHLDTSMVERVNKLIQEKLCGPGLTF